MGYTGVGQMAAALYLTGERRVRAPQDRVLGNAQSWRQEESATERRPPDILIGYLVRVKG